MSMLQSPRRYRSLKDIEGRPAAAAQEMSIAKDMDMIYDLKMLRPDKETRLKSLYEKYICLLYTSLHEHMLV